MSEHEHDFALQRLFNEASEDLESPAFVESVLDHLEARKRRSRQMQIVALLVAFVLGLVLASPMATVAETLTAVLIEPGSSGLWQALAPLNSIAGILLVVSLLLGRLLHLSR